jgi:hypothetical protein
MRSDVRFVAQEPMQGLNIAAGIADDSYLNLHGHPK